MKIDFKSENRLFEPSPNFKRYTYRNIFSISFILVEIRQFIFTHYVYFRFVSLTSIVRERVTSPCSSPSYL